RSGPVRDLRSCPPRRSSDLAQAESLADTIAFQVNEAYRQLVVARRGIDRSRPAVEQAREAYRLLRARFAKGDATPAAAGTPPGPDRKSTRLNSSHDQISYAV